jgi:hypothetical protein
MKKGTKMLLFALCVGAILFSAFINTTIKGWVYEYIVVPELNTQENEEEYSDSLFYTTVGMVLLNNLIPFTLGAAIGLYAIL